jgi:hypothetical protein
MEPTNRVNLSVGLALILATAMAGGCGRPTGSLQSKARMASGAHYGGPPGAQKAEATDPYGTEATKAPALTALTESRPDRHLIKNATLTLEARDVRQASTQLITATRAARGYVADTKESADELGRRTVTVQVRVPFERFDHSVQQIEALGKVVEKQVTAEDVTEEFVDSQAKLRNLKRTELRLIEHLNRTARLSDILLVEKELSRVRGEIEQIEGRLRFLTHRVAFSTLTVTLSEAPRPQPITPADSYSAGQQLTDAVRSLVAFGRVLWTLAIWLAVWALVWVPLALVFWFAYRRSHRPQQTG